jgi:acyl-[acyl carrier protein]--UDP-N-acetylglucosamine O-acyltransferase
MNSYNCIADDVKLGTNVRLSKFINLYGCEIGDETKIGAFVEIQKNVTVGKRCKISSHSFICEGVVIEDNVFIGHGVTFINDSYPRATTGEGNLQTEATGKSNGRSSRRVHPSAPGPRFSPTPTSARTRLWAPAASSPKMFHPTLSWPEIRPGFLRYIERD